jgi:hypothetical protein
VKNKEGIEISWLYLDFEMAERQPCRRDMEEE